MELNFNQNTTIGDLKKQFNQNFEAVRIEFYHHSHKDRSASAKEDQIKDQVALKDLIKTGKSIHLEFDRTIKISELEQIFEQDFGLHIQIFRKYGESWLQTTLSDHWSLQMAEIAAKELEEIKHQTTENN
jgi:hypothetical protein